MSQAASPQPHLAWVESAVEQFQGPLCHYASRILGGAGADHDRARDVVQETFVRLCRQNQADVAGHLAEWLYTVCRNQALDIRRKERRMTALTEPALAGLATAALPSPATEAEQAESADSALELLARLPERQQEVIRLKFQNGLRYSQIAEVTGLSASYVGFLIHTGIKTLRKKMNRGKAT